jgi:hypothetical protein
MKEITQEQSCINWAKRDIADRKGFDYKPTPAEIEGTILSLLIYYGDEFDVAEAYIKTIKSKIEIK